MFVASSGQRGEIVGIAATSLDRGLHSNFSRYRLVFSMRVDLTGKVAMVTGAAMGIGRATAEVLADNGARVIIADIDAAGAEKAANEIPGAVPLEMDVSSEADVDAGVERMQAQCGQID